MLHTLFPSQYGEARDACAGVQHRRQATPPLGVAGWMEDPPSFSSLRFFFFFFGCASVAAPRAWGVPHAEGPLLGVLAGCGVEDCPPNFSLILSPDMGA